MGCAEESTAPGQCDPTGKVESAAVEEERLGRPSVESSLLFISVKAVKTERAQLMPLGGLFRPSSCILLASDNFLKSAIPGPTPASHQPLEAQTLPHSRLSRPSMCLTAAPTAQLMPLGSLPRPSSWLPSASAGLTSVSQQTLHAQHLPHCGPTKPSSCLLAASIHPVPATQWPL
nr:putative uncharacterized protein FLJ92257 [Aotus nancymaae]